MRGLGNGAGHRGCKAAHAQIAVLAFLGPAGLCRGGGRGSGCCSEPNAYRARGRGQHHPGIAIGPELRIAAPDIDGILEIADDGVTAGGQAGGRPVEQVEGFLRKALQRGAGFAVGLIPFARYIVAKAIQHGACRADGQNEPEKHAQHIALHRHQGMFDGLLGDIAGAHVHGIERFPLFEQAARGGGIVVIERVLDVREVVAELAKTEGEIQHRHIPRQGQQQAVVQRDEINHQCDQGGQQHGDEPGRDAVMRPSRIEVARGNISQTLAQPIHGAAAAQGFELLDKQGDQNGEKSHASILRQP